MSKQAVFTLKIEEDLRDAFMAEALALDRPASQIVREFMRAFVQRQADARAHDSWFRAQVSAGMREADDPAVVRIADADVTADWLRQRAELQARIPKSDAKSSTEPQR